MNRRSIIKGAFALGATLALPSRLPAQVRIGNPRDAMLAEIATREQQKAGSLLWRTDIDGEMRAFKDIYGRDAPVLAALDAPREANRARRTDEKAVEIIDDMKTI